MRLIICLLLSLFQSVYGGIPPNTPQQTDLVKRSIDALAGYELIDVANIVDATEKPPSKRAPKKPAAFDTGSYTLTFALGTDRKEVNIETNEPVGQPSKVIPGKFKITGYVEYNGRKLNTGDLEYLLHTLYRRFSKPMTDEQATLLNYAKDRCLALLLSDILGVESYHARETNELGY